MKSEHQQRVERLMNQIPGQEIPSVPTPLSEKDRILRAKLILEEALEKIDALAVKVKPGFYNAVEGLTTATFSFELANRPVNYLKVVDSCCDCIVISTGTLSRMGIPDAAVLQAVDEANLTKFEPPKCPKCTGPMVFGSLLSHSQKEPMEWACGHCSVVLPREAGPYLREDGKWIKPPYFVPPEVKIKEIMLQLGWPEERLSLP